MESYRSDELDKFSSALSKAQGSYKPLMANENSPSGKFASLNDTLFAVKESLSSNGLCFYQHIQLLDEGSGATLLKSILSHESGQWISSCARIVSGESERQTSNAIEIQKRKHAQMLLGIAPSHNDPFALDDNGEEIAEIEVLEKIKKPKKTNTVTIDPKRVLQKETVNKEQYNELMIELDAQEDLVRDILECYGIETLADLPRDQYHPALAKIRRIKKTYEDYDRQRN